MHSIAAEKFDVTAKDLAWFGHELLHGYRDTDRPLPWKGEKDPYRIWLSEVILQQTRVEQGIPYYLKLIDRYPDVLSLADAPIDELMRLWEGLGYYRRVKMLHRAARLIVDEHAGLFPTHYESIRALPGIGDYTAAAVASLAFGMPYAVVDGNVKRVLSRFFGMDQPIDNNPGKKIINSLARAALADHPPGTYNQAIMDAGATVCKPRLPHCDKCCLRARCYAYAHRAWETLPQTQKMISRKKRNFHYLVLHDTRGYLMNKRPEGDIWAGLYDFSLFELPGQNNLRMAEQKIQKHLKKLHPGTWKYCTLEGPYEQALTHRDISVYFHIYSTGVLQSFTASGKDVYVPFEGRNEISMPRTVRKFVENSTYLLDLYKSSQHSIQNHDQ